jgi:hypothetical protein
MNRIFLPLFLLALTGCATVTADSDQEIKVTTTPAGAQCTLTNNVGSWDIKKTPGSAMVKRSFSPLGVTCKSGKLRASETLSPFTRNRAYGNLLLLGLPAVVDVMTGDGYEYRPSEVTLTLKKTK